MSDEDTGGGEKKLALSDCSTGLPGIERRSGEAEKAVRRTGVLGAEISAGGAREVCESWGSVS